MQLATGDDVDGADAVVASDPLGNEELGYPEAPSIPIDRAVVVVSVLVIVGPIAVVVAIWTAWISGR